MAQIKYYSQHGQDFLLWKFFNEKNQGYFIDIGAFDGIHLSNTYAFERVGWKGICVEANPEMHVLCRENRAGSLCLNCACVGSVPPQKIGFLIEDIGLLSTTIDSPEKLEDIQTRYRNRGLNFNGVRKIEVETITFNQIVKHYLSPGMSVDFVSIDTEGNELEILRHIDFDNVDIRVLTTEFEENQKESIIKVMKENGGFKLARQIKDNLVFVKGKADFEKMRGIIIDCVIEPQLHPKGERYTIKSFIGGKIIREFFDCHGKRPQEIRRKC